MSAYYNEIDPLKAEVLREAIKAGAIAPGDVDERSITDVYPADLVGYTQCHFFAGGGFWSLALRYAGWPDSRPVWTASTPCPSFSAAGKGLGFNDPRHLWPEVSRLKREHRPGVLFGEQVAAAIGHGWLDLVCGDMEAEGYAIAAAVLGAHSVGAPHIRQRCYFVADTPSLRYDGWRTSKASNDEEAAKRGHGEFQPERYGDAGCRAHADDAKRRAEGSRGNNGDWETSRRDEGDRDVRDGSDASLRLDSNMPCSARYGSDSGESEASIGLWGGSSDSSELLREWRGPGWLDPQTARSISGVGATRGFWRDCDWWYGRDGKYRPIGPGLQPLAHGSPARVGRLRMYGDGIVVTQAQAFIESYCEARGMIHVTDSQATAAEVQA